jgi:hypothetical protein
VSDGLPRFRYQPRPYEWVENVTAEQLPDGELLRHFLFYWDNRAHGGHSYRVKLGSCSLALRARGYDPTDIDDLRRRLA